MGLCNGALRDCVCARYARGQWVCGGLMGGIFFPCWWIDFFVGLVRLGVNGFLIALGI